MKTITRLTLVAATVAALGGCEHSQSRLDKVTKAPAAAASTPASKVEHTGTVEERLARLEDAYNKNAEALDFLNKVYAQQKQQQQAQEREEPAPDAMFAVSVDAAVKAGQVEGPASATVTIVKAFDFACPYCQRVSGMMEELVKDYSGKVRVVYANMLIHPPARPAHLASCAAAKQGKYMQFKDAFWEKGFGPYAASQGQDQAALAEPNIMTIAKGLGLDTDKLKTDMASPDCAQRLQTDMAEMQKFHVNATPTFFINGRHVNDARSKDDFKKLIDEELKRVEGSGVAGGDYYEKVVIAKGEKQFRSKMDPKPH
jgi:protein-disulfide isomerase